MCIAMPYGAHRRVLAGLTAMLLLAAPFGCGQKKAGTTEASVEFAKAEVRTFEISTLSSGELEAKERVELRSGVERQTTIVEIVPEGTRVDAGEVLVRLNSDEIKKDMEEEELQVAEAQLNLEAAQTAYDIQVSDNAADLRKAQLKVDLAKLALDQWESGDKVKQLKQLDTAIEKASRDLDRLNEKKAKSDELYKKKFISYDEWKRDEISLLEAEASYETAKLDKKVYEEYQIKRDGEQKRSDLEEAKQELDRVIKSNDINLKNRDSTRQNRAVLLSRRQERLAEFQKQFEACTIRAPKAGLVVYGSTTQRDDWRSQSEGPIAVGRQIRNNDLIIALPDTSEMVASVKVHESMAGRVRPGQSALITVEAIGGLVLRGHVESIGLLAESGGWRDPNRREYTVRIAVEADTHAERLKPSMRCQAEITLGTVENALSVPVQSVFSDGPVRYVLVPDGARLDRRPVQLGRRSDLFAEISKGLGEGDRVLVREPRAGEVVDKPWDPAQLADAGYTLDEDGKPVAPGFNPAMFQAGMPAGMQAGTPGGGESGRANRGQRGTRPGRGTEAEKSAAPESKPGGNDGQAQEAGPKPAPTEGAAKEAPSKTEPSTDPAGAPAHDQAAPKAGDKPKPGETGRND
ncbi:MAG: HlyD family efflux transporter periplasmic adaptor subunit [Phycisphaeraceae bacterium]|nr:MAG: HlyD family efflux transporter periplasmic adaptor subunit [Phycisphaeraceae bacterium]